MRRSSLVDAALVVFMSSFSFSASVSSNQPAVDSKSTEVKPPLDKPVWEVTGLLHGALSRMYGMNTPRGC